MNLLRQLPDSLQISCVRSAPPLRGTFLCPGSSAPWSSQGLVDTIFWRREGCLKFVRADSSNVLMPPRSIVERIDIVWNVSNRELAILANLFLDALFLQAAEERLGNSVVPTVASTTHTGFELVRSAEPSPVVAAVLRALV